MLTSFSDLNIEGNATIFYALFILKLFVNITFFVSVKVYHEDATSNKEGLLTSKKLPNANNITTNFTLKLKWFAL